MITLIDQNRQTDQNHETEDLEPVGDAHSLFSNAPKGVNFKKLRKRILRKTRDALDEFGMVRPGDRWLVCLSGGKDSYTLLAVLLDLKWRGLLPVELLAFNLDQAQPGFPEHVLPDFFETNGIEYRIDRHDTYSIVTEKVPAHQTYCALCSRLRRGHLYGVAREEGCSAVILGHHRDDILETFFLNFFHGGRLATMPPKVLNDEGDVMVLRPLAYNSESDIQKFSDAMEFPIIPCNLCGSQDGLQRAVIKDMLKGWEQKTPGRSDVMMRALTHVRPSHMLDHRLFDFKGLFPDQ